MKSSAKVATVAVLTCVVVAGAVFVVRARQKADIERIFAQMTKAYANCKSYRDSGTFTSTATAPSFNMSTQGTFMTAFVRPDRFRFECKMKSNRRPDEVNYIAWRKGNEGYLWNGLRQEVQQMELSLAVAAVTGISSGATATAGMLLPKEMGMRKYSSMTEAKQLAGALIDGADCFRIKGKWGGEDKPVFGVTLNPSDVTLWIDKKTFLLRKVEEVSTIDISPMPGTMISKSWITWKPIVDVRISAEELEFKTP